MQLSVRRILKERLQPAAGAVLLTILALNLQSCSSPPVVVASGPLDIGPAGVVLAPPKGLPATGPRHEVQIELSSDYKLANNSLSDLRGPNGESVVVHASFVDGSGTRREFGRQGYLIGQGLAIQFSMDTDSTSERRMSRLELSANVPFRAQRILWWSGDPGSRCFLCL